jgi:hypothetical protein
MTTFSLFAGRFSLALDRSGVTKDLTEALKWWRKAAEQGDESAKDAIAKIEEREKPKQVDYNKLSLNELKKLAEKGDAEAQEKVGHHYLYQFADNLEKGMRKPPNGSARQQSKDGHKRKRNLICSSNCATNWGRITGPVPKEQPLTLKRVPSFCVRRRNWDAKRRNLILACCTPTGQA